MEKYGTYEIYKHKKTGIKKRILQEDVDTYSRDKNWIRLVEEEEKVAERIKTGQLK